MVQDPTRDEMLDLIELCLGSECDDFSREEAIYWFSNDYYNGQGSNLYSALSMSAYSPGAAMSSSKLEGMSSFAYETLQSEYVSLGCTLKEKCS